MSMKPIDLKQQVIILGGIKMQGYAPGDAATIEYNGNAFEHTPGGDGEHIRSRNYDRSALLTIRLQQSSAVNDLLSALHNLDLNATNGAGVVPFQLQDLFGTTLLGGPQAWIEAPPNVTIAPTGQAREWKVRISELSGNWGGN